MTTTNTNKSQNILKYTQNGSTKLKHSSYRSQRRKLIYIFSKMSAQIKKKIYINLDFAFCPVLCAILAVPILYMWPFIKSLSKLKFLQKLLLLIFA